MLIDFNRAVKEYGIKATGVIQVGAHWAEEHEMFLEHGATKFIYIEPCYKAFDVLVDRFKGNPQVMMFQFAAGASTFSTRMYTETVNNGQSNSLLKPKDHLVQHPNIEFNGYEDIVVMPLDSIDALTVGCNFLVMDCQGYELEVLKGAENILKDMEWVYTEVNRKEVYEGCARVEEIDQFLWERGFEALEEKWAGGWGDKLFRRI